MKSDDYLSKRITDCVKGYLCICVLCHHCYLFSGLFANTYFGHFLNRLGGWSVAVFFFISGYGLFSSYLKKGEVYLEDFLKKRVLPFYLTYLVFVLIYLLAFHGEISLKNIITSLTFGGTVISFGWFFQIILAFYIIFWASFRFVNGKKRIVLFAVLTAFFSIICMKTGQRYTCFLPFCFGFLVSRYRDMTDRIMKRAWGLVMALAFCTFFGVYLLYIYSAIMGRMILNPYVWEFCSALSDLAIVIFVISFCYAANKYVIRILVNPVSEWLSSISLEVYALQGLVLYWFYFIQEKSAVYAGTCFACAIILAWLVHRIIVVIKRRVLI